MKKNINMNLFGTLYAIDEDAYDLLNRYLDNMKRYFSRKEGGEEIADDIEHRMAELLSELKADGVEAISIEHVKGIIERIGSPEEMEGVDAREDDGDEEENKGHKGAEWFRKHFSAQSRKKLFRNPEDQIIGGVLSGIAWYAGIDAIWFRLLTIVLLFISFGTVVLVYLLLWLLIPVASSPEDRLLMKGIPVNMENIRDEIMRETNRQNSGTTGNRHSRLNTVARVIISLILFCLFLPAIGLLLFILFLMCAVVFGVISGNGYTIYRSLGSHFAWMNMLVEGSDSAIYWIACIALAMLLALTVYIGIHLILSITGRVKALSTSQRMTYLVSWVILLIVTVGASIHCGITYDKHRRTVYARQKASEDSIRMNRDSLFLAQEGWRIVKNKNCSYYANKGEYYTGNREKRYIDSYADEGLKFEVEKTIKVAPGTYRLKAVARADGEGCRIFVCSGSERHTGQVPAYGNSGGGIWADALSCTEKEGEKANSVQKSIAKANHHTGYGWNEVVIDPIEVKDSVVSYGITNDCPDEAWNGTWFSASDFTLERIK